VRQLLELREKSTEYARRDGRVAEDDLFHAVQNARLVKNAEEYYRTMFGGRVSSWNLRDRHMADTLDELAEYLQSARVVVWEHNSHVGDARATEMGRRGEHTVGQLVRERHGSESHIVGFTTHRGEVTAATDWGDAPQRKRVRPGRPDSYEGLFHDVAIPWFALDLRKHGELVERERLERAIGVIYRPETERQSHYFKVDLARQFDDVIHIDVTTALQPLERNPLWDRGEPPETYPFGE
jgi:erythromycin esterase-like protein